MSSAKTQVAVAPNVSTLAASQIQKEYSTEDTLNRQNSLGGNRRGNMKGKHLTRSHAMRESTSPPRTPTPRNEQQLSSPNGQANSNYSGSNNTNSNQHHQHHHHYHHQQQQQHHEPNEHSISNNHSNNSNKLHAQSSATAANASSSSSSSPLLETPSVIVTSQHSQQQQQKQNVVICNEADFPKLTPPKSSKSPRNHNNNNNSGSGNNNNNNNHNHRDVAEKSNSSGITTDGNTNSSNSTKLEYNSNAKKSSVDNNNKANNANNTHNNNNNNNNNSSSNNMNNKNHHQLYSPTCGATAMQLALNVSEASNGKQQQNATSTTSNNSIYNSSMNYQLKTDVSAQQQQQQQQQQHCGNNSNTFDKENRCPRNDSQNSSNSISHDENNLSADNHYERAGGGGGGGGGVGVSGGGGHNMLQGQGGGPKKNRTTSNSKCNKPRLKTMGSSSSMDGGNSNSTSGFISRDFSLHNTDSSMEQFTDQSGIDLLTFFKETLNKNAKDRNTLMIIEKDLLELAQDKTRTELRFPSTSSYNRMLIHRTAAFFGMDHNVDTETQQCVIVAVTKGTRIPDIRFKTLFRDRMTDEPRKSILKRDTHSFDEARQSSYLCPDRGMLDRKAKSFEEREEDYEKARRRIFRNQQQQHQQQTDNAGDCEESYMSWSSSMEQQQHQQPRMRSNGKMLKVQTSTESRDGRAVSVSKTNSFSSYGVPPASGGPPLMRGDSSKSSGSSRSFSKQDSLGSGSTPWRLSPSSSGSIYHFDPSNLPPSQAITPGVYSQTAATSANHSSYNIQQQQQQQQQQQPTQQLQPTTNSKKSKAQQQHHKNVVTETSAETATQTADASETHSTDMSECSSSPRKMLNIQEEESSAANDNDECENSASNCLSVTTTTSTKSYDRIEIQKFKNQATSPNIPNSPADTDENGVVIDAGRDQPSRTQYQSQTSSSFVPQQRETPNSARSTPYSNADTNAKRLNSDETKSAAWTYTQSYQAPDGSTVFHTTNGSPYCTATTYQQGPDGSVYAIPQGMVYAYPPPMDGEVQGYFMPVFDPAHQRPETAGMIPAGTQAIYSATGGGTTVVPVATAYPPAQFATATGAPIYPGQVLYSSEQFPANGATPVAGTATPGTPAATLQQYPVTTTYPIGYSYPCNGFWGQTMTTYIVPTQQPLTNATPILSAQPPTGNAVNGSHLTGTALSGGAQLTNNIMLATAAAGPPSATLPSAGTHSSANGSGSYLHSTGGSYSGGNIAGRGKRTTPPHQHQQSGSNVAHPHNNQQHHHHQSASGATGITTTYQLGHALPTFALAATPANAAAAAAAAAANELGNTGNGTGTTMYAIPQHAAAAMFPANILPYATAAAQPGAAGVLTPVAAPHHATAHHSAVTAAGAAAAAAHAHQANTVISPLFSHPPQQLFTTQQPSGGTHAPGPSAIAIVDPATVCHTTAGGNQQTNTSGNFMGNSTPQSAPSTPHSLSHTQQQQHQRNPPLFATPPISAASGGAVNYHYYAAPNNEAASYGNTATNSHSYASTTYEKRSAGSAAGKKPTYSNNNNTSNVGGNNVNNNNSNYAARQNAAANSGYATGNHNNKALLHNTNETRSSPNTAGISVSSNYQGNRPHAMHNKRSNEKTTTSNALLNGPSPLATYHNQVQQQQQHNNIVDQTSNKSSTPGRMNNVASGSNAGGGYRQKPNSFDFRRSASQRNSPSTNSSNESSNNSPSSLVSSPPNAATYTTSSYVNTGSEQQPATSLYIARGPHIPPTMAPPPHGLPPSAGAPPPPGAHQVATTAVLGGVAAEVAANAAAAAAAVATGHQPLLGTYNTAPSVYIKYGQTYFAHPTMALPNSRRSPQSDLRPPQMAPMPGMYPAVNMMLPAPTRPVQPRHPNPNYKGTRSSR